MNKRFVTGLTFRKGRWICSGESKEKLEPTRKDWNPGQSSLPQALKKVSFGRR